MDLPEEHDATDTDRQPEDTRTLVAALTNLLVNDPSPVQGTESRANLIDRPNLIDNDLLIGMLMRFYGDLPVLPPHQTMVCSMKKDEHHLSFWGSHK
jgi:hypothetical protein